MLKLRRPCPINRNTRPIVRPCPIPIAARTYHRFNSKTHAWFRHPNSLVLRIMRDIWRTVKEGIDAMTDVGGNNRATICLGVFFDGVANIAEGEAGLNGFDGEAEAFAGGFDKVDIFAVKGRGADIVGFVKVTMVAAVVEGNVKVQDIAVEEDAGIRDAVADHFVRRSADGFGKVIVVEWGGIGVSFYAGIVADFVKIVRSHSWFYFTANNVQNFA